MACQMAAHLAAKRAHQKAESLVRQMACQMAAHLAAKRAHQKAENLVRQMAQQIKVRQMSHHNAIHLHNRRLRSMTGRSLGLASQDPMYTRSNSRYHNRGQVHRSRLHHNSAHSNTNPHTGLTRDPAEHNSNQCSRTCPRPRPARRQQAQVAQVTCDTIDGRKECSLRWSRVTLSAEMSAGAAKHMRS